MTAIFPVIIQEDDLPASFLSRKGVVSWPYMTNTIRSADMIAPLKGLVLAGGESSRMGLDKGTIEYHGMPQRDYLMSLLLSNLPEVFLSSRPGQVIDGHWPMMEDAYTGLGPFGAILTAFHKEPHCAWLVVACDFPLLDQNAILQLIQQRNPKSVATSFLDTHTLMPEPWISILEPSLYPLLQQYYQRGRSSLRGILVDYNSTVIRPDDPDILLNANTPEESEALKLRIKSRLEPTPEEE